MDMQITHQVLFAAFGVICGASGWWLRVLHDKVEVLRRDHEAFKYHVATNGVQKTDLQAMMREFKEDSRDRHSELKGEIKNLSDTINKKQDKS